MKRFDCRVESSVSRDSSWDALRIDGPKSGIRISARDFRLSDDGFSFGLIICCRLSYEYCEVFRNIINGMVLTLEETPSGGIGALRLGDPDVRPVIPNFAGRPPDEEKASAFIGEHFGLQILSQIPLEKTASLDIRVCMQKLLSNCINVRFSEKKVINHEEI